VKRVLDRLPGVQSYDISLETQKVVVKGDVDAAKVKEAVAKTGKKTDFWQ
jgi:copper chaperone